MPQPLTISWTMRSAWDLWAMTATGTLAACWAEVPPDPAPPTLPPGPVGPPPSCPVSNGLSKIKGRKTPTYRRNEGITPKAHALSLTGKGEPQRHHQVVSVSCRYGRFELSIERTLTSALRLVRNLCTNVRKIEAESWVTDCA